MPLRYRVADLGGLQRHVALRHDRQKQIALSGIIEFSRLASICIGKRLLITTQSFIPGFSKHGRPHLFLNDPIIAESRLRSRTKQEHCESIPMEAWHVRF
jgi:hypothetical protein